MIAVDTNVLVYSHRSDSPFHSVAKELIDALRHSPVAWAIPWPCIHEFVAMVTHPGIFKTPLRWPQALRVWTPGLPAAICI